MTHCRTRWFESFRIEAQKRWESCEDKGYNVVTQSNLLFLCPCRENGLGGVFSSTQPDECLQSALSSILQNIAKKQAESNTMFRYILPLVIFAALAVLLKFGLTTDLQRAPSPLIGKQAPVFSAPLLSAPEQSISLSDLMGKVSLINIWASWCTACYAEHPVLLEMAKISDLPIYGLNYKDTHKDAIAWLAKLSNPYEAVIVDIDGKIGVDYGVYGVPETLILDQNGIIRYKHVGPISNRDLQEKILPLVNQLKLQYSSPLRQ